MKHIANARRANGGNHHNVFCGIVKFILPLLLLFTIANIAWSEQWSEPSFNGTFNNTAITGTPSTVTLSNTPVQSIACGGYHTLVVKTDGTLWAWGLNGNGQLGIGNTTQKTSPVRVGTATNWANVAFTFGECHTLALKNDGKLYAWGYNGYGNLGLGDTTQRTSPVQVGSATWNQAACGAYHTLAIKTDGSLWAWGFNQFGQLGDGTTTNRNSPVQVGSATNWQQVACGAYYTLAVKTDGTLWGWGANGSHQLGISNTSNQTSPVQVGTASTWKQVACGRLHTQSVWTDKDY